MTRLRITTAGAAREVEIEGPSLRVGRSPDCDIHVTASGVSREHAELTCDRSGWSVRDLGSSNGTFVNGERVERMRLENLDVVSLGESITLQLLTDEAPASAEQDELPAPEEPEEYAGEDEGAAPPNDDDDDEEVAPRPAPGKKGGKPRQARKDAGAPWWTETRWCLVSTGEEPYELDLRGARVTVGRDETSGLTLDDASVSRMHARLDAEGPSLTLTDLKSGNGTWVNGERVLSRPVAAGDVIRFGDLEFTLEQRQVVATSRLQGPLGIGALFVVLALLAWFGSSRVLDWERGARVARQFRTQAVESVQQGVAAAKGGDADLARGYFKSAADMLVLSGIAPEGADASKPAELFREISGDLQEEDRDFDFQSVYDAETLRRNEESLVSLSPRQFVEHELRRYCAELRQDPDLPPEFVDQVMKYISEYQTYPAGMRIMLRRSRVLEPRIVAILARHRLPAMVSYVAWVESDLDPTKRSPVGALGLWQLMEATAQENGLRVHADPTRDERTDVEKSTNAAARYLATMLKDQGPEYFMLVLASYNRGHNALKSAKQKVDEPMLSSTRKYWYLIENKLLPEETRNYVPKILAVRLIAESPGRFGFQ